MARTASFPTVSLRLARALCAMFNKCIHCIKFVVMKDEKKKKNPMPKFIAFIVAGIAILYLAAEIQDGITGGNKFLGLIVGPFLMYGVYWVVTRSGLND